VFMGMGEPAHNLDAVLEAIADTVTPQGMVDKNLVFSTVGDRRAFERLPLGPVRPALALSLHSLLRRRVDAVIVVATVFAPDELAELGLLDIPMVAVGPPTPGLRNIGVDDADIMGTATAHMLDLGHRTIGLVGGYDAESLTIFGASEREHAFMRTVMQAGAVVEPTWMLSGGYRSGMAKMVVSHLYRSSSWPTALVCASDEMAFGALFAIHEAGLRVPDDVSVIGIDGHENSASYDLTTCEQDAQGQGALAASQVIAELEGAPAPDTFDPAPFRLIVRGSTAEPRVR